MNFHSSKPHALRPTQKPTPGPSREGIRLKQASDFNDKKDFFDLQDLQNMYDLQNFLP
jgi:hypothetical protein